MTKSVPDYQRTFEQLEEVASKFWPAELSEMEAKLSIIPLLLKTQDQFIHILSIETDKLDKLFDIIEASSLPSNLFLKHLAILADFGGEMLKRVSREFELLFPERKLNYFWRGQQRSYTFKALPKRKFSNTSLRIDGKKLFSDRPLDDLQRDAVTLLLFGSAYSDDGLEVASPLARCEIGDYLGKPDELVTFIKQRYIWVSRITGGAQSNSLGQLAQKFVGQYIEEHLSLPEIEKMMDVYEKSIPEMKLLGEFGWCNAAINTRKRLIAFLGKIFKEDLSQLARECHADLQGYVRVKFESDIMNADDCYKKKCYHLFEIGQRLVEIGGMP